MIHLRNSRRNVLQDRIQFVDRPFVQAGARISHENAFQDCCRSVVFPMVSRRGGPVKTWWRNVDV
ncbi:hypothetical protein HETIRDRAFT_327460 [Heterobasidion irregulare TC 32-1]|uniref:Uncharacterized protein n=1 Tax=Heterobasidion irregulare (strain TC 32-1) TaxID=747525 RepID=W4JVN6_HETIT|nr:uncharacterized protein HETIRDRAFT_327460 [Heterobasidion irregulare TC 32-1]ETW77633.1 hypothetical protein HETIRDRAFT_327460 [Heterobasidion irregulare TC 32-1]